MFGDDEPEELEDVFDDEEDIEFTTTTPLGKLFEAEDGLITRRTPVDQEGAQATSSGADESKEVVEFMGFPEVEAPPSSSDAAPSASEDANTPAPASAMEAGDTDAAPLPPWLPPGATEHLLNIRSPMLRLHQEMVYFARYIAPTPAEAEARDAAIERVASVAQSIWPVCELKVFGSYATGLYLPTSDIDTVLINTQCDTPVDGLRALANALHRRGMAKNMQVIAKAKVPIVKFQEVASGLMFDISFDIVNGCAAADWVCAKMKEIIALQPLCLVLKVFLQQRELNEVYSGGIGSYALLTMIICHLMMHPSRQLASERTHGGHQRPCFLDANLGKLLLDFFELYGRKLRFETVGVSCRGGGQFFEKRSSGMDQPTRPAMYCVEDPQQDGNNVAQGSWNAPQVRSAFDFAYQSLLAVKDADVARSTTSLLQRVVRVDGLVSGRACPEPPDWKSILMEEGEIAEDGKLRDVICPPAARSDSRSTGAMESHEGKNNNSGKGERKRKERQERRKRKHEEVEPPPEGGDHGAGAKNLSKAQKRKRAREEQAAAAAEWQQWQQGHDRAPGHDRGQQRGWN